MGRRKELFRHVLVESAIPEYGAGPGEAYFSKDTQQIFVSLLGADGRFPIINLGAALRNMPVVHPPKAQGPAGPERGRVAHVAGRESR